MKINRGNFESNIFFLQKTGLLDKNKKILEIGSGTGYLVKYLSDQGYNVTGIEINSDYIDFAKKEYEIDLLKTCGDTLNFPDNSFDIVLSFDVFEHIKDSDKHLLEVKRVLKQNGYYLLQTPNKWTNVPFEVIRLRSLTKYKSFHCSLHNYWEIKRRFKKHNFDIHFVDVPVVNDFFRQKVKKFFGNMGIFLLKIINPDKMPMFLKTNFYISAKLR